MCRVLSFEMVTEDVETLPNATYLLGIKEKKENRKL